MVIDIEKSMEKYMDRAFEIRGVKYSKDYAGDNTVSYAAEMDDDMAELVNDRALCIKEAEELGVEEDEVFSYKELTTPGMSLKDDDECGIYFVLKRDQKLHNEKMLGGSV